MQDRANLNSGNKCAVEEIDPLIINKSDEALRKLRALFACNPAKIDYEASRRYDFVMNKKSYSIKLTKPLMLNKLVQVNLNQPQSLLTDKNGSFRNIFWNFKQNFSHRSIWENNQDYLLAFEDEDNRVVIWYVTLSHSLVMYPRKKDLADMRFAVLDEKLSSGGFGQIFMSRRSLSSSSEKNVPIKIKEKSPDKYRIVKTQEDEYYLRVKAYIAQHEYDMTSKLAPDLVPKRPVKNWSDHKSAMLMRYVPGNDLWTIICSNRIKSDLERLEICLAVANALSEVHARGGVHCDVKPPNVLCFKDQDGKIRAKFVDYGCSILQRDVGECIRGTDGYFAPELSEDKATTVASDVYSLYQSFNNVFGYKPSPIGRHDKSNCETLRTLGWNALLEDMSKSSPEERASLDNVIERLNSIIAALKAKSANQSRSIFSPAAAAAPVVSELTQELESCTLNLPSLSP